MLPLTLLRVASGLLMLALGAGAFFFALRVSQQLRAFAAQVVVPRLVSRRWPAVAGTIIGAEARVTSDSTEDTVYYEAVVRYAYTVHGRQYESEQADLTWASSSRAHAQGVLMRYPVGSSIPVYYDPQSPQRALIDPVIRLNHALGLLLLILAIPTLLATGALVLLLGLGIILAPEMLG